MSAPEPASKRTRAAQALVFGFTNLLVLGTVVAGALGGVFLTLRSWLDPTAARPTLPAVLLVAAAGAVLFLIARAGPPRSHRPAALLLIAIVLSRIVYTLAVHEPRFSDFAIMWDYAESIATGSFRQPGAGGGLYEAVVQTRALPYLTPVAILSGGRPFGYQIANAITVGLCALLAYGLANSVANRKAGLIALWLIAVAPEPLMAAEIPTHDIPGTLFALIALGIVFRIHRWSQESGPGIGSFLGAGLVLGLILLLADLQRATGLFLLVAIGISAVILGAQGGSRRWGWALIATVVIPLSLASVLNRTVLRLIAGEVTVEEAGKAKWRWIAIYANSESTGYWDLEGLLPLLQSLDEREVRTFALARAASDIVDAGPARIRNYATRIATLNRLGSQYHWYLDDTVDGRRWIPTAILNQQAGERVSAFLRSYSEAFRVPFLLLAVLAVSGILLFSRPESRLYLPLLVLAVLLLALGFLGEAQPRYLFPAWFLLPVGIGWFLTGSAPPHENGFRPAIRRAVEMSLALIITGIALVLSMIVLRAGIRSGWPRLVETRTMTYSGGALTQGRYRSLFPGDSAARIEARLSQPSRVAAFTVRALHASLPCSSPVWLAVNQRRIAGGMISAASVSSVLGAELAPDSEGALAVGIDTPDDRQKACPVYVWLLHSGR